MTDFSNASVLIDPAAAADASTRPLPNGHRMEEFEITGVLGAGGFGIVYRAFDHALERVVAIKEYMPAMLALRQGDLSIALRGERFAATFKTGQAGFINEARLLAKFDHPGLIKVLRFWEDHGTAYMATPCYEGLTLKQRLAGGRALGEAEIMRMLAALLGALETLHRAQCFHRDIALDNILMQPDGTPVLLDFGSARKLIGDLVDDSSIMLKPGYSPIEQYTDDPAFPQGPWTDIYALGAVIHILVSGQLPPAAVVRSISDNYQPLEGSTQRYSATLLRAADAALRQRIEERPQSVGAFATLLGLASATPGHYSAADQAAPLAGVAAPAAHEAALPASPAPQQGTPRDALVMSASVAPQAPSGASAAPGSSKRWWVLGAGASALALGAVLWQVNSAQPPESTTTMNAATPPQAPPPIAETAPVPAPPKPEAPAPVVDSGEVTVPAPLPAQSSEPEPPAPALADAEPAPAAKPAAEPVRKPIQVALRISPWGEVYVNGKKRGVSPPMKSLQLMPGDYQIEVRNGSLTPHRLRLQVTADAAAPDVVHAFKSGQP
ncbi:protein kinase [Massilia sp. CCM 8733]|uniref:non-specific serine/threonine protein kinase n=1 Tax=Massilia mucilaginosa TaxID=2609282 RepID=A0ABX0NS08_9BURK|nr:serine/threonine-protein kinase [Massilia mucilaginosa]NHZ89576.1 protein kinase [Massilia mucilaginosa]